MKSNKIIWILILILFLVNGIGLANNLDTFMDTMTKVGDADVAVPLLLISPTSNEFKIDAMKSLIYSGIITEGIKYSVGRKRPPVEGDNEFDPFNGSNDYKSFPSGHATGAFSVARTVSEHYPKYKYPYYTLATMISASRVYKNRHYPLDVIVGSLIGYGSFELIDIKF
ncbi:MAG: phosphatase PAP2 family protein [Bacillota bacterium]